MSAAQHREFGPHPLTRIREGMEEARLLGIPIRIGGRGVIPMSVPGRDSWQRDYLAGGVDPIGAAILAQQPPVADIDRAAELAVNASVPWVEGCIDGMERREPSTAWSESVKAMTYTAGYSAGLWLRTQLFQKVEPSHGGGRVV